MTENWKQIKIDYTIETDTTIPIRILPSGTPMTIGIGAVISLPSPLNGEYETVKNNAAELRI